jgi:hypothetical protein
MILNGFKYSEPITLISDGLIAIECIIFAFLLFNRKKTHQTSILLRPWIFSLINFGLAGISGAVYHFSIHETTCEVSWKFILLFSGAAVACFQIGLVLFANQSHLLLHKFDPESDISPLTFFREAYQIGIYTFSIYVIILVFTDWSFLILRFYSFFFLGHFVVSYWKNKHELLKQWYYHKFGIVLLCSLILGIFQGVGKYFHWGFYFGENQDYFFHLGNEIYHFGILYPIYIFFQALKTTFLKNNLTK